MGTNLRYKFLPSDLNICEIVEQILIERGANMLNNPSLSNLVSLEDKEKKDFLWRRCLNGGGETELGS